MIVPSDRTGCGYYRLIWPGQAVSLVRKDWTVSIVSPESVQAGFSDGRFIGVRGFPDPLPDLLVMQRVGTPGQWEGLKWASRQGIATVVDFDDAMWCIDKDNYAWRSWNLSNPFDQHWRTCDKAAAEADLVTCTTPGLERRYSGKHGRTEIIGNYVPTAAFDLPKREDNEVFTAGWSGFTVTHPGDCRVSKPAVETVLAGNGTLRVIADGVGAAQEWGVAVDDVDCIPPQKLGPSYYEALSGLDLMLVGLLDTPFNRAKSTLKVLEAASQGVPSIAPDNPPHRALAKAGFPVTLAASPDEWRDAAAAHMKRWSADPEEAKAEVFEAAREDYTIEGNAERWAAAWERAMKRKNG
jgi:glycosyltransferase involved in cell wall biosynthesis